MSQFFCDGLKCGVVELDPAESLHAGASRRLEPGQEIRLFDGRGVIALGRILPDERTNEGAPATRRRTERGLRIKVEAVEQVPPPSPALTLIVAAPKGERLEWMVEKCTELGVARIVLAEFERSVSQPREARLDKLRRIAREACKQCGRAWLPEIRTAADLGNAILGAHYKPDSPRSALLIAHLDDDLPSLAGWKAESGARVEHIVAVIGPEGGLSDSERNRLREQGGREIRLATHTLRVETAAVALASVFAALE